MCIDGYELAIRVDVISTGDIICIRMCDRMVDSIRGKSSSQQVNIYA
jgi:hypothetical protein